MIGTAAAPTSSGAKLTATVYPYGADTHYYFEYGTNTSYGTDIPMTPGVDLGSAEYPASTAVEQTIGALTSGVDLSLPHRRLKLHGRRDGFWNGR